MITEILQAVKDYGETVVVAVLAFLTYSYMRHTGRIADTMGKQAEVMERNYELIASPIAKPSMAFSQHSASVVKLVVTVRNEGSIPMRVLRGEGKWWIKGKPEQKIAYALSFASKWLSIHEKDTSEVEVKSQGEGRLATTDIKAEVSVECESVLGLKRSFSFKES